MYEATFLCLKGNGGMHLKQTKIRKIEVSNDKCHIFKYTSFAWAEKIPQTFGMKDTSILRWHRFCFGHWKVWRASKRILIFKCNGFINIVTIWKLAFVIVTRLIYCLDCLYLQFYYALFNQLVKILISLIARAHLVTLDSVLFNLNATCVIIGSFL